MSKDEKTNAEKGAELVNTLFRIDPKDLPFPERFKRFTIEHLFGDVWQGEALETAERSLLTCAILTALGREAEQLVHFTGARNLGIPREKVVEMITHVAHYAGWPVSVSALRNLNQVWPESD